MTTIDEAVRETRDTPWLLMTAQPFGFACTRCGEHESFTGVVRAVYAAGDAFVERHRGCVELATSSAEHASREGEP